MLTSCGVHTANQRFQQRQTTKYQRKNQSNLVKIFKPENFTIYKQKKIKNYSNDAVKKKALNKRNSRIKRKRYRKDAEKSRWWYHREEKIRKHLHDTWKNSSAISYNVVLDDTRLSSLVQIKQYSYFKNQNVNLISNNYSINHSKFC
jgi:hypothetical protein